MKVLLGHLDRPVYLQAAQRLAKLAPADMQVDLVPAGLRSRSKFSWPELDLAWRTRDPQLLRLYDTIARKAQDYDVFFLGSGWNLHPRFVQSLPTFNVFCFYDDPESSERTSRHLAPGFDGAFFGNIASAPQYQAWGCRHAAWLPVPIDPELLPSDVERASLFQTPRDNDIILCCGLTRWRKDRLESLVRAFPQARCFGHGWSAGYISNEEMRSLYNRSRVGWNVHNSTGPINSRLFTLAAWGIVPICDNRVGLGHIFELEREAIGFDTTLEAIERTRALLAEDDRRQQIAQAAYHRFWRDYHPQTYWLRFKQQVQQWQREMGNSPRQPTRVDLDTSNPAARAINWCRRSLGSIEASVANRKTRHFWDERFYAQGLQPFDPHGTTLRPVVPSAAADRLDPACIQQALAWALCSLIYPARRVHLDGPLSQPIAQLASRDPNVQLLTGATASHTADAIDLHIATQPITSSDLVKSQFAAAAPRPGRTVVLLQNFDTAALSQIIPATHQASLLHQPDPLVPWLEPVHGRQRGALLIAVLWRATQAHP